MFGAHSDANYFVNFESLSERMLIRLWKIS